MSENNKIMTIREQIQELENSNLKDNIKNEVIRSLKILAEATLSNDKAKTMDSYILSCNAEKMNKIKNHFL